MSKEDWYNREEILRSIESLEIYKEKSNCFFILKYVKGNSTNNPQVRLINPETNAGRLSKVTG